MELRGDRVVLRPLAEGDVARIVELGADPEVARWWRGLTHEHVLREGARRGRGRRRLRDRRRRRGRRDDPVLRGDRRGVPLAGIDLFLGAPFHGRGLGTDAVRTMARHLIDDRGHHRLDDRPGRAQRARDPLLREGRLPPVGIMREYWLDPDGIWRDGLLLDLLACELAP